MAGVGQFSCGAVRCGSADDLRSLEVLFKYQEGGATKRELVKVRVCRGCAKVMLAHKLATMVGGGKDDGGGERRDERKESKKSKKRKREERGSPDRGADAALAREVGGRMDACTEGEAERLVEELLSM